MARWNSRYNHVSILEEGWETLAHTGGDGFVLTLAECRKLADMTFCMIATYLHKLHDFFTFGCQIAGGILLLQHFQSIVVKFGGCVPSRAMARNG